MIGKQESQSSLSLLAKGSFERAFTRVVYLHLNKITFSHLSTSFSSRYREISHAPLCTQNPQSLHIQPLWNAAIITFGEFLTV